MSFAIFSFVYGQDDRPIVTFKKKADCSMGSLLSLEEGHRRENLFFCPFDVHMPKPGGGWKPRQEDFKSSEWFTLDLDGVEETGGDTHAEVVAAIEKFMPSDPLGERYYIWTGNGLQALYRIPRQTGKFYKPANVARYRQFATLLSEHLVGCGFHFKEVDTRIFEPTRLHRLPGTINSKPGKKPKMAILLDAINEDSGEPNENLLKWFLELPDAAPLPVALPEEQKGKIEGFLRGTGAIQRGNYWLMSCPFHKPDKKPSFAYYPETDRGVDFHCERGSVDRVKNFAQIYQAVTGKTADEYCQEFNISVLKSAVEIICEYLNEWLKPTHFTRTGIFSEKMDVSLGLKTIQDSPSIGVLKTLLNSSEFCEKIKKSPKASPDDIVMAIYRAKSVLALATLREKMPIINFVTVKNRDKAIIIRRIHALLHKTITVSIDGNSFIGGLARENAEGGRQHLKKCSLLSYAKSIAVAGEDGWLRIGHYEAFTRVGKEGSIRIAIRYVLLASINSPWYDEFTSSRDFSKAMAESKVGKLKTIWAEGKAFRCIILSKKLTK